jgi:Tfp pilus assembly protein PilN
MASKSQLNFLPEDYLEKRRQQRTNVICLSLFGIVMAGVIGAFLLDERRQADAARLHESINKRMDSAGLQLAQIEEMQARKDKMIRKADVTAALLERRPRHFLLACLTNALPKGASLESIELTSTKVANPVAQPGQGSGAGKKAGDGAATFNPPPARLSRAAGGPPAAGGGDRAFEQGATVLEAVRVVGMAPNDQVVSRFIASLDSMPLFRRVDLERSEEFTYRPGAEGRGVAIAQPAAAAGQLVRRFILRIELDDQAEVTDDMVQAQQVRPGAFDGN